MLTLLVVLVAIIPIMGRWGLKSESWRRLRDMNKSIAHEESQKVSAESLGGNSGEFSVMEAKDVKISSCQKLRRHQRDEKETDH